MALKIKSTKEEIKNWVNDDEILDYLTAFNLIDEKFLLKQSLELFIVSNTKKKNSKEKEYFERELRMKIEKKKKSKEYPN
ncbi:MAG: hypothetical protein RR812_06555, partial [Vagococcus sp.]